MVNETNRKGKTLADIPQDVLFEIDDWQKEWQDMPEFIQGKIAPYAAIIVRFAKQEDLEEFAKLIGQKLTNKTKSIWHPKLVRGINSNKRYRDES